MRPRLVKKAICLITVSNLPRGLGSTEITTATATGIQIARLRM